jgi:MarR family protein
MAPPHHRRAPRRQPLPSAPAVAPARLRLPARRLASPRGHTRAPARPLLPLQRSRPIRPPGARAAPRRARPPGATKTAVLQALSGGDALTAGEVATATGLGRGTVSTTVSKLAKNGEVRQAARGYQLAGQPTPGTPTDAAISAENEQPGR